MNIDNEEVLQMIDDCEERQSKLTAWEIDFIASLSEQITDKSLTDKQIGKLGVIWERVTSNG